MFVNIYLLEIYVYMYIYIMYMFGNVFRAKPSTPNRVKLSFSLLPHQSHSENDGLLLSVLAPARIL